MQAAPSSYNFFTGHYKGFRDGVLFFYLMYHDLPIVTDDHETPNLSTILESKASKPMTPPNTHSFTLAPITWPQVCLNTLTLTEVVAANKVAMAFQTFYIGVLVALGLLTTYATGLTSYERSFTPYSRNLSCYVCEPGSMNLTNRTYVQWEIENRRCEEPTEDLIQLCEETEVFKPRGCGKLVTKSYQQINFGGEREVKLVRRFCSSSGMSPEEQKCVLTMSQGRWTEMCVCGGEACNGVGQAMASLLSTFGPLLLLLLYLDYIA
ncbi:hypothetical protein TcWFU_005917 [Taenia crassiceps]|uniref:Protein quiver n=1 Tax=Taenia crassiceps TaxID=6207 RepID=A0ABR4Q3Z5_9CEST